MVSGELLYRFLNVMLLTALVAPLVLWRYRRAVLAGMKLDRSLLAALALAGASAAHATPGFVNGLALPATLLDLSGGTSVNNGRVGFFSDISFDPNRNEWWGSRTVAPAVARSTTRRACSGSRSTSTAALARSRTSRSPRR